jgi:hypothetical protein
MRQFATLQTDLESHIKPSPRGKRELKVKFADDEDLKKLDESWKERMPGTPVDFVVGVLNGLQGLVPEHDRVYVTFSRRGAKITFEIKLQEMRTSAKRPEGGTLTRAWTQLDATRWYRNVAGVTRDLSFDVPQVLNVRDERTDAPTGQEGGSGFTKQLFKNLLGLYAKVGRAKTVQPPLPGIDDRHESPGTRPT